MPQVRILNEDSVFNVVSGEWQEYESAGLQARAISRTDYGESTPVQLSWAGASPIVIPASGQIPYWSARSTCSLNWGDPVTNIIPALNLGESYMPWRFRSQMNVGTLFSVSYEAFWYAESYRSNADVTSQVNWFTFDFMGRTVLRQDCPTSPWLGDMTLLATFDPDTATATAQLDYFLYNPATDNTDAVTYTIDIADAPTTRSPGPVPDFRVGLAHRLTSSLFPAGKVMGYYTWVTAYAPPAPEVTATTLVRGISAETCGASEC